MAKKKKRKVKKPKAVKARPKAAKRSSRRKVALIFSIVAIAILAINAIYYLAAKEAVLTKMQESLQELPAETLGGADVEAVSNVLSTALYTLTIIWLILAVAMVWITCLLERKKRIWGALLAVGIISLLTGRLGAGILGIISSILYKGAK